MESSKKKKDKKGNKGNKGNQMEEHASQKIAPLVVPRQYFHSFFTTGHLFTLSFVHRMNKLLTYDIYKTPSKNSTVNSFITMTNCDIFAQATERVYEDYLLELRFRNIFKRLLYAWRMRRILKKTEEPIDPITFQPIVKPVYVYDMAQGHRFIFEANTLTKSIHKNLYAQMYTVPEPKRPVNVYTNKPFSTVQLISIHDQLKHYPFRNEDLSIYSRLHFNIEKWKLYMRLHLSVSAIHEELYDHMSDTGQDMLYDYIVDTMFLIGYHPRKSFTKILYKIITWWPDHPIMHMLRSICMKTYEADYFNMNIRPILHMRFKVAIDMLWPKSELLDTAWERYNKENKPQEPQPQLQQLPPIQIEPQIQQLLQELENGQLDDDGDTIMTQDDFD
jgi:hypothetical protein